MSTVHGIREERAIVCDRKGSCYVLGVTGGWRVKGARKREHQETHEGDLKGSEPKASEQCMCAASRYGDTGGKPEGRAPGRICPVRVGLRQAPYLGCLLALREIARCARARGDLFRSSDSTKNRERSVQIVISVMAPCDENTFQLSAFRSSDSLAALRRKHNRRFKIDQSTWIGNGGTTRAAIDAKGSSVGEAGRPAGGAQPRRPPRLSL